MADVVILGGGIGGVVAANRLRRLLPSEHRVTIVERQPLVSFPPAYLRVLDGRREPAAITRDLRRLQRRGIEVTEAEVTAVDVAASTVQTASGAIPYDYLVIALGAALAPEAVPGFADAGHNIYTLDGCVAARDAIATFQGGTLAVAVASLPYKCPAAPYEAALLADTVLRARGIRDRCEIRLFVPEPAPMPVAGPVIGEQVQGMLRERRIDYQPQHVLASVDAESRMLAFEGGDQARYDLLLGVPRHAPPPALAGAPFLNDAGWVAVDMATLETSAENVFAIGDATAIVLPSGMPLPKAGVFAEGEAEAVARTIAHRATGRGEERRFNGHGSCFLETGDGSAGYATGDFYSAEPGAIVMRGPARWWLWQKSLFERWWLWRSY